MQNRNDIPGAAQPGSYRPISLPHYASVLVTALTRLQRKNITLNIGQETWRLRFSAQQKPIAGQPVCVRGEWLGYPVDLWFPQVLLQRTLQICNPELHATTIPPALFSAVASNAVGAWLDALPHHASLRIDSIEDGAKMPADVAYAADAADAVDTAGNGKIRLQLLAQCTDTVDTAIDHAIAIDLDPALIAALPRLSESLPPDRPSIPPPVLRSLPLRLQCEIGTTVLPYATLKAMQHGDILFFHPHAEPDVDDISSITLQLSHRRWPLMRARIQQPDLMVITSIDMNDSKSFLYDDFADEPASDSFHTVAPSDLQYEDQAPDTHESGLPLDTPPGLPSNKRLNQLPLQVVFDVGSCEMRFDELSKLQPGAVIPLTSRMPEIVRVSVNGRHIASGELVEVDGMIGVMIAHLADAL